MQLCGVCNNIACGLAYGMWIKLIKGNGQGTALDVQFSEKLWKFLVGKNMA